MKLHRRLTIEFGDGDRIDEYRIRKRYVEFRTRADGGSGLPNSSSSWRQLAAEDVLMHLALDTVVGEWLKIRMLRRTGAV